MRRRIEDINADCRLDVSRIIEIVSDIYEISPFDVTSKSRNEEFVKARYSCYAIIESLKKNYSFIDIGAMFNRDHSSIIHGRIEHLNLLDTDKTYKTRFNKISEKIKDSFIGSPNDNKTYQVIKRIDNSIKGLENVKKMLLESYFDIKDLSSSIKEFLDDLFPDYDKEAIKEIIGKKSND